MRNVCIFFILTARRESISLELEPLISSLFIPWPQIVTYETLVKLHCYVKLQYPDKSLFECHFVNYKSNIEDEAKENTPLSITGDQVYRIIKGPS